MGAGATGQLRCTSADTCCSTERHSGDSSEPVVATKLWTSGWLQHADLFPAISPDGVDCLTGFMGVSAVSLEPEPYASVRVVFWKNETRAFVALHIHGKPRTISSLPDRAVDRQVARSGRQVRATVYSRRQPGCRA